MPSDERNLAVVAKRPGTYRAVLTTSYLPYPPPPGPGEVVVRMSLSTVNPSDTVTVSGAYSRTTFPMVPGFEGVGVIAEVGDGVSEELVGKRVLPLGSAQNWQRFKIVDAEWCVPVPDSITDEQACFAYVNPLTAWLMVERFCASGTRNVVVTGANSTIGAHLAELLNMRGIRPFGVLRSQNRPVAEPARWASVVHTENQHWMLNLSRDLGFDGADIVFDCVGGLQGAELDALLNAHGSFIHYGLASGTPLPADHFTGGRAGSLTLFRLRDVVHSIPRSELPALMAPVFGLIADGHLGSPVGERVGLSDLVEHLEKDAGVPGKVLIDVQR